MDIAVVGTDSGSFGLLQQVLAVDLQFVYARVYLVALILILMDGAVQRLYLFLQVLQLPFVVCVTPDRLLVLALLPFDLVVQFVDLLF